jgi:hypothetical protein
MSFHLAEVNIARMLYPLDHPAMADFVNNLDPINRLAESSEGFIWRLKDEENNATTIKIYDDDFLLVNLSVWESIDRLYEFAYRTNHVEIFKRKREWFEKMPVMYMAMWYVPAGHLPTVPEAQERLTYLREKGDTPWAFSFKKRFEPDK